MRAYSAGGVVFRLTYVHVPEHMFTMPPLAVHSETDASTTAALDPLETMSTIEVALVGRSNVGSWALPKGTPQHGETVEQVAVREAQEETGLQVRLIAYIGSISYFFIRDQVRYHKQVRHFLLEAIGGDTSLHDHEYDRVEWFPLHEACRQLTYQNEVHILYQAEDMLQRRLEHQRKESKHE